jgi:hypothetical protein
MDNGDKFFASFQDSTTIKNGQPAGPLQRHVALYGRDRQAKGLAGQGNIYCHGQCRWNLNGGVEGDYTIAEPTLKAAKQKPPSQ